jgi:hypothetical protein
MGSRRKLDIIVDAEYKGGSEISQAKNDISDLDGAAGKSGMNFGAMAGSLAVVTGAAVAVGAAAKVAYDTINEGAALGAAAGKFDNLSASINTTGDSLLGKMREATKGMITDAELVAAGTDIMNLGLSKTEGGVVRMSAAVGALNLDMGVLAMTLANDSVMRLDALGLAMEDVNNTKKELISSGFIGDAFDEAVLIELEKKMVLLGDASLTTAGQMQILTTEWQNITDAMKQNAAQAAGPVISSLSSMLTKQKALETAVADGIITQNEFNNAMDLVGTNTQAEAEMLAELTRKTAQQTQETEMAAQAAANYTAYQQAVADSLNDTSDALAGYVGESLYATQAQDAAIASTHAYIASQLKAEEAAIVRAASTEKVTSTVLAARDAELTATATMGDFFTAALNNNDALVKYQKTYITTGGLFEDQQANLDELSSAYSNHVDKIQSLESGTAGLGLNTDQLNEALAKEYEAMALIETRMNPLLAVTEETILASEGWVVNQEAVNSSLYAAADAAGASATELALLGLATGELTASQAEAALKSAAMAAEIERLGEALASGMDPAAAMAEVQSFAEELNNTDFSVQLGLELENEEGKTSEKQDEIVKGLENISAASFTTGSDLTSMSSQAVTDLETLRLSFDNNTLATEAHIGAVGKLKDLIIDGLPNEKIIKIKIVTEGSVPNIPGSGQGAPGSAGAGVPTAVSDSLGG